MPLKAGGAGCPALPVGSLFAFCVQDMAAPPRSCPPSPPALPLHACSPWALWTSCPPALLLGGVGGQQAAIIRSLTAELRSAALGAARTSLTGGRVVSGLDGSSWTVQPPRTPPAVHPPGPTAANAPAPGRGAPGGGTAPHPLICFLVSSQRAWKPKPGTLGDSLAWASIPPREPNTPRPSVLPGTWKRS